MLKVKDPSAPDSRITFWYFIIHSKGPFVVESGDKFIIELMLVTKVTLRLYRYYQKYSSSDILIRDSELQKFDTSKHPTLRYHTSFIVFEKKNQSWVLNKMYFLCYTKKVLCNTMCVYYTYLDTIE